MALLSNNNKAIVILLLISTLFVSAVNSGEVSIKSQENGKKSSSKIIDKEKEGMKIHLRILRKYKKIDAFYKSPTIWGVMTGNPLAIISIPIREWEKMSEKERDYISKYAAGMVKIVKIDPFKYCQIPNNAPVAPMIRKNVSNMNQNSWGIMGGRISDDGRDILSDKLVRSGN